MRIGFIDHHLNNYHADKFLSLVRGPLADMGAEIAVAWESNPTGDDWCAKNDVPRARSIEEAVEGSDAVMILAPDNIPDHLELARQVLPYGRPTAIDKALAFDTADARAIVELSKQHNTPITSSSALAFAGELEALLEQLDGEPKEIWVTGMGEWKNYGLHTLSMALRVMGAGIERLIDTGTPSSRMVTLDYGGGKRAFVTVRAAEDMWGLFPWTVGIRTSPEKYYAATIADYDAFYQNLMKANIEFFRTGRGGFPGERAMALVAVLEGGDRSNGEWVRL
jgi:predicted dehydrogenase